MSEKIFFWPPSHQAQKIGSLWGEASLVPQMWQEIQEKGSCPAAFEQENTLCSERHVGSGPSPEPSCATTGREDGHQSTKYILKLNIDNRSLCLGLFEDCQ